ncbi:MAG: hypothetical protein HRU18_27835 [Pseudoalteromonas sp.]|uniref:hypothetical protein n=1 Tax=Pseudoalteromonas sp. TaxID=53249 RepID=UPI001D9B5620|nr:hypothetical protein [Pseudoalteromonas sp.]NRA82022.1 hypothetical protein [Pseudoalteromonas sp.]
MTPKNKYFVIEYHYLTQMDEPYDTEEAAKDCVKELSSLDMDEPVIVKVVAAYQASDRFIEQD